MITIDQYDDEWYKLESAVEMREVTQLPNELLRDISTASVTFNCHSYAWLRNLRTDYQHIWMSYASAFANDSYYESSSVAKVGDIANWATHSAQVIQTNVTTYKGYPEHRCISKWEGGPIVSHNMRSCPYYDTDDPITYYRVAE